MSPVRVRSITPFFHAILAWAYSHNSQRTIFYHFPVDRIYLFGVYHTCRPGRSALTNKQELQINQSIHPFERSGLGVGPFRLTGVISLPNASIAEANPAAFNGAMRDAQEAAKRSGVRLGVCDHCGAGLMRNAVVTDSAGKCFVVGLDCAMKVGDASLGSRAKIEANRIRREAAAARKAAQHEAWLDTLNESTGETNRERVERERAERGVAAEKARQEREEAAQAVVNRWAFWISQCEGLANPGNFVDSMISDIRNGREPSGRAFTICGEIFAKTFGRSGSKKNDAALQEFEDRLNN